MHPDFPYDSTGCRIKLALWDTAGQEGMEVVRQQAYHNTYFIILCFAVDSRAAFEALPTKYGPEISLIHEKSDAR